MMNFLNRNQSSDFTLHVDINGEYIDLTPKAAFKLYLTLRAALLQEGMITSSNAQSLGINDSGSSQGYKYYVSKSLKEG